MPGVKVTAGYATIVNNSNTRAVLTSIHCEDAKSVEIHDMSMNGTQAKMIQLQQLVIPANSKVNLKPMGKHLMIFGMSDKIKDSQLSCAATFAKRTKKMAFNATLRTP